MKTTNFSIGDVVENFGLIATVIDFHKAALSGKKTGMLIVQDDGGIKWVADPDKCKLVCAFDDFMKAVMA